MLRLFRENGKENGSNDLCIGYILGLCTNNGKTETTVMWFRLQGRPTDSESEEPHSPHLKWLAAAGDLPRRLSPIFPTGLIHSPETQNY